ncbi:MAG: thermonuclease family protein [Planctomycetes bacterium]|nr:thermonuclease family protein [Planctomycetota bacterium]
MLNLLFLLAAAAPLLAPQAPVAAPPAAGAARPAIPGVSAWAEVARVVDGDTIHVQLDGKLEKLRLLCVDTEEKLGSGAASPSKPQTVFGEECALWAQEFFAARTPKDGALRVGLRFPVGREGHRDPYGRLLCHVVLPDGTDFNVLLVKLGKSPYFTKYGYSEVSHEAFVAAQAEARAQQLGIWNPATNAPQTPGAPSAARPYDRLLPWWDLRARAVAAFEAAKRDPERAVFDAESAAALEQAVAASAHGPVRLFGEVARIFDETDGSRTVLFRAASNDAALRVRIQKDALAAHAPARLDERAAEFHQNYVWYEGTVVRDARGYRSTSRGPAAWRAGHEPGE